MEMEFEPKKMAQYFKISALLGLILALVEWYMDFSKPIIAGTSLTTSEWILWLIMLLISYPLITFFVLSSTLTLVKGFISNKFVEALVFLITGGLVVFIIKNLEVPFYFTPISFLIVPLFYLLHLIPQQKNSQS